MSELRVTQDVTTLLVSDTGSSDALVTQDVTTLLVSDTGVVDALVTQDLATVLVDLLDFPTRVNVSSTFDNIIYTNTGSIVNVSSVFRNIIISNITSRPFAYAYIID